MLRMLRDGAKSPVTKIFLFGLMGMAVVGLVFMDVQGVFRGGVAETNVAEIGEGKITKRDFSNSVRRAMQQQRMPEAEAYKLGVIDQILNQEIQTRLLRREAYEQGLYVGDRAVAGELDKILSSISASMDIDKTNALMILLQNQQMTEEQLVGNLKTQIGSSLLLDGVLASPYPPNQLVKDFTRFRYENRSGSYIKIDQETAGKPEAPSEEELQAYYEQIAPHRFSLPEYRKLDIAVLSPESVEGMVSLTEEELRAEYENRADEYKIPAQWSIAQTLVSDAATAQQIADLAKKGTSLSDATKQVLGDTIAYVPPETFTKGALSENLRDTVLDMSVNDVSDPVESPLGWHVIKLDKKTEPFERSFADVRDDIHDELMMELAGDSLYDLTIQFDDMIAGGMTAKEAAAELDIELISLEALDISGKKQDGEMIDFEAEEFPDVVQEAFEISVGQTTQLYQSGQSDYIAATVTEVIPARLRPYDEVKDEVRKAWMAKETRVRASKMAGKLIERLRAGEDMAEVAAAEGLKVHKVKQMNRQPDPESKHPAGLATALFTIDKLGAVENMVSGTDAVIIRLDDITYDIPEDSEEELAAIGQVLSRLLKQDRMSMYRMALYEEYDVEINEGALKEMFATDE